MKYDYYVGILEKNNTISYVTRVDNYTKTFYCEKGKPAKKFTKTRADDLMTGMILNCCTAAVIKVPDSYNLSNPSAEEVKDSGKSET